MTRLVLFLAVLWVANLATINGEPSSGSSANKRLEKLQHLKEQFELFRKELDQVLEDSSIRAEESIAEPVAAAEGDKRCDCSDESLQKRCPNDCGKKKTKTETKTAVEVQEDEKRCEEGCDENDPEKRCPNDCRKKSGSKTASEPVAVQDSPIMKRFLKALPVEDQELVQHSRAKKQFIERLIRRTHFGPNKDDIEAEKAAISDVSIIEERSLPAKETSEMAAFKKSLDSKEQQLLKNYNSKARYIQGALQKQSASESEDQRDAPVADAKRQIGDPVVAGYVQNLPETDKLLIEAHPSAFNSLKEAILSGTQPEEQAAKREFSPVQIEDIINKLGNENDKDLAKAHLSRIGNLAEAEKRPVGSPEEANEVVSKFIEDIKLAKKGGINLDQLFEALKKRANDAKKSA